MGRWVRWFGAEEETPEAEPAPTAPQPLRTRTRVMTLSPERARVVADLGEVGIAPAPTGQISVETLPAEMLTAVLVDEGVLTRETEYACLQEHRATGRPVEDIICESEYVAESELMSILSRRCKVPHLSLEHYQIKPHILESVPAEFVRANRIMPLDQLGKALNVATSNPLNIDVFRRLEEKTGLKVKPVLATPRELQACVDKHFPAPEEKKEEEPEPTEESFRVTAKALFRDSWLGRIDKEEKRAERAEAPEEPGGAAPHEAAAPSEDSRAVPLSEDEASAFVKTPDSVLFNIWAASVGAPEGAGGGGALPALPLDDAEFAILAGEEPLPARPREVQEPAKKKRRSVRKKSRRKRKKKSGR